jgi:hypothetical protein
MPDKLSFYNLYCDESCHLLNDDIPIMGFGSIIVPRESVRHHSLDIRSIKNNYNCRGELKWTKVSNKNIGFYIELVDYFFAKQDLRFRGLIVHNKHKLKHEIFNQGSHDLFYYKMYYELIKNVAVYNPDEQYEMYLDIKDTKGAIKVHELEKVFANKFRSDSRITNVQEIRSHESNLVQLTDFILGAITYANRGNYNNNAKAAIIKRIKELSGYSLKYSTEPWESKFNLFHFNPREV